MLNKITVALAALFVLLAILLAPAAAQAQAAAKTYDGEWWQALANWEQAGFMNGYMDCHAFEYRGTVPFTKAPQAYVDALNVFYQQSAEIRKLSVSEALDRIRSATNETSAPAAAGATSAAHGNYDGHYWFDAETPQVQLGFVEGYLACHSAKAKDADGHFTKAAEDYVTLINDAYGITDDSDDVDPEKGAQKIADVLHRLRDEAAPVKP